jgi:hypothetical protein
MTVQPEHAEVVVPRCWCCGGDFAEADQACVVASDELRAVLQPFPKQTALPITKA